MLEKPRGYHGHQLATLLVALVGDATQLYPSVSIGVFSVGGGAIVIVFGGARVVVVIVIVVAVVVSTLARRLHTLPTSPLELPPLDSSPSP